jgi:hypothetical protein
VQSTACEGSKRKFFWAVASLLHLGQIFVASASEGQTKFYTHNNFLPMGIIQIGRTIIIIIIVI